MLDSDLPCFFPIDTGFAVCAMTNDIVFFYAELRAFPVNGREFETCYLRPTMGNDIIYIFYGKCGISYRPQHKSTCNKDV